MPIGTVVTDEHLSSLIQITNRLSADYAERLQPWVASPFSWLLTLPSRTRGAAGEKIVDQWLTANGYNVSRSPHSGCDRIVGGTNIEIKFSTLWEGGSYAFQQLRDQDYAFVFCLGLSPNDVHAWMIPKDVVWQHAIPQHGGKAGKDTRWLSFPAKQPPAWLAPFGGSLATVLLLVQDLGKG